MKRFKIVYDSVTLYELNVYAETLEEAQTSGEWLHWLGGDRLLHQWEVCEQIR